MQGCLGRPPACRDSRSAPSGSAAAQFSPRVKHIIWGSVERLVSSTSSTSADSDAEQRQKIRSQFLAGEVQLLDDEALSTSSSTSELEAAGGEKVKNQCISEDIQPPDDEVATSFNKGQPWAAKALKAELAWAGLPAPFDGLPSKGSVLHATGSCRPCLFVFEDMGCSSGGQCRFCHSKHAKRETARIGKGRRDRFRKLLAHVQGNLQAQARRPGAAP